MTFPADVLQRSLSLWDGVNCFINHDFWGHDDVRDLCGIMYSPVWSETGQGPLCQFRTAGPGGPVADALGREMVNADQPKPRVGFSADVLFTVKADGKTVDQILRVYTVDLVFDPARGGAFLRALNSAGASGPGGKMSDQVVNPPASTVAPNADIEAAQAVLAAQVQQARLAAQAKAEAAANADVRAAMCGLLLESALNVAKETLPAAVSEDIRARFSGRAFEPSELTAAMDSARKLVSELTSGKSVVGLSGARQMFDSRDQLKAATDDLLGVERDPGLKGLKVSRLSGIRDLYLMLTGDDDFHGVARRDNARVHLSTGSFVGLVTDAMNKIVVNRWTELGKAGYDWWTKISTVEHTKNLQDVKWLTFGTIASTPIVAKGAEYTPAFLGDGKETSTYVKYGHYIGVDLEDIINDDTRKLKAIPVELATAGIRKLSALVAGLFSAATYTGPTMADGAVLFNNTAVTTVGGHANLTATAFGADYTAWNALALMMYNQPMLVKDSTGYAGTGAKQAIWPSICLVNSTLKAAADALFVPRWASAGWNDGTIPAVGGHAWGGMVEPVCVPDIASTTWWAAVCNPVLAAGVMIGEAFGIMPEIFVAGDEQSPAMFMNDELRIKSRHWLAVGVADFRPLGRGNV